MKAGRVQKTTILILVLISILYFCVMIPANLTGSETPEMLEVFEVDEYAQYPHVIRMLTPGDGLYQTGRNFLVYLHYFYGYPFYFWSAISILPLKLFSSVWPDNTRVIVCVLRQMISVLPMILSAGLLTWITTKFKRPLLSSVLFQLLLTMPAVLDNDFWWHPDSLTLLFLCLTFFFLDRDQMRCEKNFLFAAAACGAAIGTKYLGFYFAFAIPAYLLSCRLQGNINTKQLFKKAILFVLVMVLFILISDPLLLLPQERTEIIEVIKHQSIKSGIGIFVQYQNIFLEQGVLPEWFTKNYLRLFWLILAFISLGAGLFSKNKHRQTMSVLFLLYIIAAFVINLNTAASRLHYFLPIMLPLVSQIGILPEFSVLSRKTIEYVLSVILVIQIGINLHTDSVLFDQQVHREETSESVNLYKILQTEYLPLSEVPAERMTRVFRDWKVYFPEQEGYAIMTDWELGSFAMLDEWQPDLVLLEQENIKAFSSESVLDNAVNTDRMRGAVAFYLAASEKNIPGYELLLENDFGMVFRKVQP